VLHTVLTTHFHFNCHGVQTVSSATISKFFPFFSYGSSKPTKSPGNSGLLLFKLLLVWSKSSNRDTIFWVLSLFDQLLQLGKLKKTLTVAYFFLVTTSHQLRIRMESKKSGENIMASHSVNAEIENTSDDNSPEEEDKPAKRATTRKRRYIPVAERYWYSKPKRSRKSTPKAKLVTQKVPKG